MVTLHYLRRVLGTRVPLSSLLQEQPLEKDGRGALLMTPFHSPNSIKTSQPDRSILGEVIILDVDDKLSPTLNPDGTPTPRGMEIYQEIQEHLHPDWAMIYPTPNGFRVVYSLETPILPEQYAGTVAQAILKPFPLLDKTSFEYSRRSFIPLPGDNPRGKKPFCKFLPEGIQFVPDRIFRNTPVSVAKTPLSPRNSTSSESYPAEGFQSVSECHILQLPEKFKKALLGESLPFDPAEPSWEPLIFEFLCALSGLLSRRNLDVTTVDFYPLATLIEDHDEQNPHKDWLPELESKIQRYAEADLKEAVALREADKIFDRPLPPCTPPSDPTELVWPPNLNDLFIHHDKAGGRYYAWNPREGTYFNSPLSWMGLKTSPYVAEIARLCPLVQQAVTYRNGTHRMTGSLLWVARVDKETGATYFHRDAKEAEFVETFCTSAGVVCKGVDYKDFQIKYIDGAATITAPLYRISKSLTPKFVEPVQQWIRLMGGGDYKALEAWLSYSLHFTKGLPALFIKSVSGAGKSTLQKALSRCIQTPDDAPTGFTDVNEFYSGSQSSMLVSPFIKADEGLSSRTIQSLSQDLKKTAGRVVLVIQEKYEPNIKVECSPRWMVTTNNYRELEIIYKELDSSEDKDNVIAVGRRILVIEPAGGVEEACLKLRDSYGDELERVIAQHLLWMHQNPGEAPSKDGRWAVEGNLHQKASMENSVLNASSDRTIIKDALDYLIIQHGEGVKDGLTEEEDGTLWVSPHVLSSFLFDRRKLKLSAVQIGKHLAQILGTGEGTRTRRTGGVWWKVTSPSK